MRRLILFVAITVTAIAINRMWLKSIQPRVTTAAETTTSTSDQQTIRQQRELFETQKQFANTLTIVVVLGTAWILIPRSRPKKRDDSALFSR